MASARYSEQETWEVPGGGGGLGFAGVGRLYFADRALESCRGLRKGGIHQGFVRALQGSEISRGLD